MSSYKSAYTCTLTNGDTTQAIPNTTTTLVQFNVLTPFDPKSMGNAQLFKTGVRIPIRGFYLINISVTWEGNANAAIGLRRIVLQSNGSWTYVDSIRPSSSGGTYQVMTIVDKFSAGDNVQASVFHSSGAAMNIGGVTDGQTRMTVTLIAED